ncbi:MAG: hypothetical protein OHK0031_14930 [Anaerolineales bacterium]
MDEKNRLQRYRRLIEISRDLASTLDLDPLLNRIIEAACDITDAQASSILLYDDASKQLFFQVATNMEPQMRGLAVPLEGSIAGWIVTNRQPLRIGDVNQDRRYFKNVAQTLSFDTQSLIGVPLITKEKVVGVLEVLNKNRGEFTDDDEDLLSVLGAQAAIAIENTRLFQQSDLIAEFVHELRNPLASVNTATYLLLRPEISAAQGRQIIENIQSETMRLTTLASSFLDLARLESGRVQFQKSTFALEPLLQECLAVMQPRAQEGNISVSIEVDPSAATLEADRDKLKQVVLNLLSNAIKYNRPGGSVRMQAKMEAKNLLLTFADSGTGIPDDEIPHLFQKFYRTRSAERKVMGTGLGLSICKGIIQGHGGRIEVKSKLGEGTAFIISLPQK